jgi:IclR family pca regulon transcriptional regulator
VTIPATHDGRRLLDDTASAARSPRSIKARDFVQSLDRGLLVIRCFTAADRALSLGDVSERAGLNRATTRRFLLTLVDLGYLESDGRLFWLSPRVLELGHAYLSSLGIPDTALPDMEKLTVLVEESADIAVLDGAEVVLVLHVPGPRIMAMSLNAGTRIPAHATATGRVLLASLEPAALEQYLRDLELPDTRPGAVSSAAELERELINVRETGWAIVDHELEPGLRTVAAPIRAPNGNVLAAAGISSLSSRRDRESLRVDVVAPLLATIKQIETKLHVASAAG